VIQGSAIGPASFIVTASDLQPVHTGNALIKFADDTYVIVPADNSDTSTSELMNVKSCRLSINYIMTVTELTDTCHRLDVTELTVTELTCHRYGLSPI